MQVRIQTQPNPDERRWRVRRDVSLDIPAEHAGAEHIATVHNLSENGLLLESTASLPLGSTISLDLPDLGGCSVEVVWQKAYLYGCRFHVPLPKSAVSAAVLRSPLAKQYADNDILSQYRHLLDEEEAPRAPASLWLSTAVLLLLLAAVALFLVALMALTI
ncbi:PilZ domain-containing protein [Croceicoccus ponticola]|uniref:PilZ domain-containing protein n=1 Tax=Croceicoccus ponticola TaxID=2217664 RepID=A0A437GVA3_9SPHN|nr:PilZ domain-containing protein [Croceicoccus ponticola]RVQ65720.1 PilZ domain-containing protein [Croceicoccus ponticola]